MSKDIPGTQVMVSARARALLTRPRSEWPAIAEESTTPGELYRGYILKLAALPPIASILSGQIFGYKLFGITLRPSLGDALGHAITQYLVLLALPALMALILNWLAPKVGGTADWPRSLKVMGYGLTAAYIALALSLFPPLHFMAFAGLLSIYAVYTGLPVLMGISRSKAPHAIGGTILLLIGGLLAVMVLRDPPPLPGFGSGGGKAQSASTAASSEPTFFGLTREQMEKNSREFSETSARQSEEWERSRHDTACSAYAMGGDDYDLQAAWEGC